MAIVFTCPQCRARLKANEKNAGRLAFCRDCNRKVLIPSSKPIAYQRAQPASSAAQQPTASPKKGIPPCTDTGETKKQPSEITGSKTQTPKTVIDVAYGLETVRLIAAATTSSPEQKPTTALEQAPIATTGASSPTPNPATPSNVPAATASSSSPTPQPAAKSKGKKNWLSSFRKRVPLLIIGLLLIGLLFQSWASRDSGREKVPDDILLTMIAAQQKRIDEESKAQQERQDREKKEFLDGLTLERKQRDDDRAEERKRDKDERDKERIREKGEWDKDLKRREEEWAKRGKEAEWRKERERLEAARLILLAEKEKPKAPVERDCITCSATGMEKVSCNACSGRGKFPCTSFTVTRSAWFYEKLYLIAGPGRWNYYYSNLQCEGGRLTARAYENNRLTSTTVNSGLCPTCNGQGFVDCPLCFGSRSVQTTCSRCKGKGKVSD